MNADTDKHGLPHNLAAEQSVLGSVFIAPRLWPTIASQLPMDAFFLPAHRVIYDAMVGVVLRRMPIDTITVADEIRSRGELARLEGGEDYLLRLAGSVPTSENVDAYVGIVRKTANLRSVIHLCAEAASRARGDVEDDILVEDIQKQLSRVVLRNAGELTRIGACIPRVLADIEERQRNGTGIIGVRTGVRSLDILTCGFRDEEMVIFGADPGSGKSALAVQAGLGLCIDEGGTCFDGSLEMPEAMVAERALAHLGEVNSYHLRRGKISIDDAKGLQHAGRLLESLDYYVADDVRTVREFAAKARVWRARHPAQRGLAIFDFLQLAGSSGNGSNRAQQVGQDARDLKALARELKVPVIAISSLSRSPKDAAKAPPRMSDLKESGDVEYAADFVILIWNADGTKDGPVNFVVAKNRNSPAEMVSGHWIGRHFRFCDFATEPQQQSLIA